MKQSLLFTLPIIAALALNSHAFVPLPEAELVQAEKKHLQGRWKVVGVEQHGAQWSNRVVGEWEFVITGNRILSVVSQDIAWDGTLSIAPWKKQLDIISEDDSDNWYGIYQIDGDTLKWCIRTAQKRPTQFVTTKDGNEFLLVLKRIKDR